MTAVEITRYIGTEMIRDKIALEDWHKNHELFESQIESIPHLLNDYPSGLTAAEIAVGLGKMRSSVTFPLRALEECGTVCVKKKRKFDFKTDRNVNVYVLINHAKKGEVYLNREARKNKNKEDE